jgi:hypothetical protein
MEKLLAHHDDAAIMCYNSFISLIGICENHNPYKGGGRPPEELLEVFNEIALLPYPNNYFHSGADVKVIYLPLFCAFKNLYSCPPVVLCATLSRNENWMINIQKRNLVEYHRQDY